MKTISQNTLDALGLSPAPQANTWPASHRLLATALGVLGCLLAGVGCQSPAPATPRAAVAPSYSYVHDQTAASDLDLWPVVTVGNSVLLAGDMDGR